MALFPSSSCLSNPFCLTQLLPRVSRDFVSFRRPTSPFLSPKLSSPLCFLPPAPIAQSLSLSLVFPHGLALPALPQLPSSVLNTSFNASLNLVALCSFIVWMQKSGHLPSNTAQVLSQVSFNLVIPAFLMSKVSQTIAVKREGSLIALPFIAIGQILLGSILGKLGCIFLNRRCIDQSFSNQDLAKRDALITTACAFGNTVTLPLVFLNGVLSSEDYSSAAGYLALFTVGWSPCLWTLGYQIITSTERSSSKSPPNHMSMLHIDWMRRILNPPLIGVLAGILIGGTPLSHFFLPSRKRLPISVTENFGGILHVLYSSTECILQPIIEAAKLLGSASVPLQVTVLASTLATSITPVGYRTDGKHPKNTILSSVYVKNSEREEKDVSVREQQAISLKGEAFWVVTFIRLLVMPLICFMLMGLLRQRRCLPADPICILTLLVVAAMPTAQNLVVLAQLHANTRPLAEVFAKILLGQYSLSLVSLTMWITIFLLYVGLV